MTVPHRVIFERDNALIDAYQTIEEYGVDVIEYNRNEHDVHRDKYNSIKVRDINSPVTFNIKAFPVIFNPTQDKIEKAGIKHNVECIITTAMKSWTDLGLTYESIDEIRDTITLRGQKFVIKDKALVNQFADTFLFINIGLSHL
jgi:hypothetical protein